MKRILAVTAFAFLFFANISEVPAQKVRLRSQITPACTQVRATSGWKFADIYADGNIAVQGSYGCNGAFIYDLTNPDAPVLASWYNPGNNQQFLEAIVIGNRGYFGSGSGNGGVHIVDLTNPYSPVQLGTVNSTNGNGYNVIHEMMVFDHQGARYLLENFNGTSGNDNIKFINVSNPATPVFKWDLLTTDLTWIHAFHIRGNKLYTSGWGGKIDIYNLSDIATQVPNLLGSINGNSTNHSSWTSEDGNYLYSARETFDGDLRVYDVTNPAVPLLVRSIRAGDLGINAVTPHNPVVMGNKLYVAWYQAGVQVFDISVPSNPIRVGQYDTFQPAFAPTEEEIQELSNPDPWDMICNSASLQNALPSSYNGDWAVYPFLGESKVLLGDLTAGLVVIDVTRATAPSKNIVSDFDADGKTDFSVYTPSTGDWTVERSSDNSATTVNWGLSEDVLVTGDYDGDGKSDHAIWRPSTGTWWFVYSSNGLHPAVNFGLAGDIPVPADYDADGKTDIAVWRPSNGVWYILQSTLGIRYAQWGTNGDKVFAEDYEGDGKADLVVWRPSSGVWYIMPSSSSIPIYYGFGLNGDKPVFADYDGDGRADFAVYRPSTGVWYAVNSATNAFSAYQFGLPEDMPIPADYDGDGKTDITVFRPSTNVWYRLNSSNGAFSIRAFGQSGDRPSPMSVQPQ
jgi:hypothetical protein